MIKFVSGDILRTKTQYLAQGVAVGSQEGLGTGLALKISKKWADAQKQFKRFTLHNKFEGGNLFVAPPERVVRALFTLRHDRICIMPFCPF